MNTFLQVRLHGDMYCCWGSQTCRHKRNGWVTVSPQVCLSCCHCGGMLEEVQWLWGPGAVWQPHFPDSSGQGDKEAGEHASWTPLYSGLGPKHKQTSRLWNIWFYLCLGWLLHDAANCLDWKQGLHLCPFRQLREIKALVFLFFVKYHVRQSQHYD